MNYQNKIIDAINKLCGTVKVTLGPKGRNVVIDNGILNPFITNDGVTIAKEVYSLDKYENAILSIAKEVALKTNENVGDGTTTSLVLLQSILNDSFALINKGYNPLVLKKEMEEGITLILKEIDKLKRKATNKDIESIATLSSKDQFIGLLVSDCYKKVGPDGLVLLEESSNEETMKEIIKGYEIDCPVLSPYMLKEKNETLKECYVLITNYEINDFNLLTNLLNEIMETKRSLLIICEDMSEDVLSNLVLNKYQNILDVIAVKAPNYGENKINILEDIALLTNGVFIDQNVISLENVSINDLGIASKAQVNKERTIIVGENKLKKRIKEIKNNISHDFNKEIELERIAKLSKGIAVIKVGAKTKTEMMLKKLRTEDAIRASKAALDGGVVSGGGITFLKVYHILDDRVNSFGLKILLSSLTKPFEQIISNCGLNYEEILKEIKKHKYNLCFDASQEKLVPKEIIIDPANVLIEALKTALSIAGTLITTDSIIVNDKKELENVY